MTIAVGVVATDGIVLAADTQLTIPQLWKGEAGKFTAAHVAKSGFPSGACAITGATSVIEYLHRLGDDLRNDFIESVGATAKERAFRRCESIIRKFHRRYVFPVPRNTPQVFVLIGYERDGVQALWKSWGNMLVEETQFAAAGAGDYAASGWLNRVWKPGLDVPKAAVLATFAAAVAKDSVDGCGKHTHVIAVEGDDYRFIDQSLIDELDDLYEVLTLEVQPSHVLDCLGEEPAFRPSMAPNDFRARVAKVTAAIRDATPESVRLTRQRRWKRLAGKRSQKSPRRGPKPLPPSRG